MTDQELKDLVASLAVDQKALTEKMAQTDKQLTKLSLSQQQTEEQMQRTEEQMRHTDALFAKLSLSQQQTEEQMQRTEEQMRRTDEKLARVGIMLGNIGRNQGEVAEEFFFNSLIGHTYLGRLHFDDVVKNMEKHRGNIQEEYDIVMTNSNAIGIIEVKYKAHENDVTKLERKLHHFKQLFPIYQNYKLYGALAAFHINDAAKRTVLERGFFVLQRKGKLVHTETSQHLAVF